MTAGARILVAESDELLQRMLKRALEREGYTVVLVPRTAELSSDIAQTVPNLIVLGIRSLDAPTSGRIARLRGNPHLTALPVVVWAASDTGSGRRELSELGIVDYVMKGQLSVLLAAIKRSLGDAVEPRLST
jgi:two-component system, OmpR family, phosphate regulon response regulator PhoB